MNNKANDPRGATQPVNQMEVLSDALERRATQMATCEAELASARRRMRDLEDHLALALRLGTLGGLVGDITHKLNNPLGVVLGHARNLVKQGRGDASTQGAHAAIERQAQRAVDLVAALGKAARAGIAGGETMAPEALLRRALAAVPIGVDRPDLRVIVEPKSGSVPDVRARPDEIVDALLHLLRNASQATPAGGTLRLRVAPERAEGRPGVALTVQDTGEGIPRELLPCVFDLFFTTRPPSAGLGLSLARLAVQLNAGSLTLESAAGQGTRARIWLPAVESQ